MTDDSTDITNIEKNFSWGSYENIHRYLDNEIKTNSKILPDLFHQLVCITEKLDGSNLAIHVKLNKLECIPVAIYGRNSAVWTSDDGNFAKAKFPSYGNAGSLGDLPRHMLTFSHKFAQILGTEEVIVYGEAYRTTVSTLASWHPFGYRVIEDDWRVHYMTSATHAMFCDASGYEAMRSPGATMSELSRTSHVICPPPILFTGALLYGIEALFAMMMEPKNSNFEGCFIVNEDDSTGYKWKTGLFEEQLAIPNIDFGEDSETLRYYSMLKDVYLTKNRPKPTKAAPEKKVTSKVDPVLNAAILTAYERELSKSVSFADVPKSARMAVVKDMTGRVVTEIESRYVADGVACPWSNDMIKKAVSSTITPLIMR